MYYLKHNLPLILKEWAKDFFEDESGDTNFISILIILGIVIVLVMFFQGKLDRIIEIVTGQVNQFTGFTAE